MSYLTIKQIHVTCVALSGLGFLIRGIWMLLESPLLNNRLTRILPHIIDTALLSTALILVYWSQQYPFVLNWLTVKVIALVVYVICGAIALRRGKSKAIRWVFLILAILTYFYIIAAAITRSPTVTGLGEAITVRWDSIIFSLTQAYREFVSVFG